MTGDTDSNGVKVEEPVSEAGAATPQPELAASQSASTAPAEEPKASTIATSSRTSTQDRTMSRDVNVKPKRGRVRRFIRSLISHLVFAGLAVTAVFCYVYHRDIFGRLGDELCTDDRLGGYMTKARAPAAVTPSAPAKASSAAEPVKSATGPAATNGTEAATAKSQEAAASTPNAAAESAVPAKDVSATAPPAPSKSAEAKSAVAEAVQPEPGKAGIAPPIAAAVSATAPVSAHDAASSAPIHLATSEPPNTVQLSSAADAANTRSPPGETAPPPDAKSAARVAGPPVSAAASSSATTSGAPATSQQSPDTIMAEWQAARQAYSANKAEAVAAYRALIAKNPQIVELRGEFGNVLYGLGRTKEAAEEYYEAALLHLKGPQPELAACLADVIARIDPRRAEALKQKTTRPCPYQRP